MEELADSAVWNMNPNFTTGKYFKLMNDITDSVTVPIPYFMGVFDGQNNNVVMSIMLLNGFATVNDVGLFRRIINSTVKNLRVTGHLRGRSRVGGIVGRADSSQIINCHNSAFIKFAYDGIAGGIVGNSIGSVVEHSSNIGTIEGLGHNSNSQIPVQIGGIVGGIVGINSVNSTVLNSFNAGLITDNLSMSIFVSSYGGIVGRNHSNVSNNVNVGVVICGENHGCIVGETGGNAILENNYYDKQMCVCCEE